MTGPQPACVSVRTRDGVYDVLLGSGLSKSLPSLLRSAATAHHYAIISDSNVAPLHADRLKHDLEAAGLAASVFVFPAGEANKTRETWASLSDRMLQAGVGRDGCVVAVGGGVTGDLAGFVAATFMRGIPLVIVPTSTLAMIDASIGGKTGVDSPAGKNLIGAFHPPRLVVSDPETLDTLPDEEFRSGLAEAVKHGAIADTDYLGWLETEAPDILRRDPQVLESLLLRSIEIKAEFVSGDEREAGARAALNFGHTIGHALERLTGFDIPHGHAVSIGMVAEARLGEAIQVTQAGTAAALVAALDTLKLPTALPGEIGIADLARAARSDKKAVEGQVRYTLLSAAGRIAKNGEEWTHPVAASDVLVALQT